MAVHRLFDVEHTGVTDFNCISVEYIVQFMILMKFFI